MFKKVVATSVALASLLSVSVVSADKYEEIACSTDAIFSENSCNQCFDGWIKWEGDTAGQLVDLWVNNTGVDQVMYKELNFQKENLPKMISLNGASWVEDKVANDFWKPTDALNALFDSNSQGFLLKAGQSVNWIETTEGSSYHLEKNTADKWANIGLLVYSLNVSPVLETWELSTDTSTHKECVLFKSGAKSVTPTPKQKPKELPKTWPEHFILLLLLAMFLAFGILRFKKG